MMANPEHVGWVSSGDHARLSRFVADGGILDLSGADFSGMSLAKVRLSQGNLSSANFNGTVLREAILDGCNLIRASFRGADLSNTKFDGADCTGADFSPLNEKSTSFTKAHCNGAKFLNARLMWAEMSYVSAAEADFTRADLTGVTLDSAVVTSTSFEFAILKSASLRKSTIYECRLRHANIDGSDFFETDLGGTRFDGTKNARLAKNLDRVASRPPYNFEDCEREFPEIWCDWERIRAFGRLPLFGASYTALLVTIAYISILSFYNEKVDAVRDWAEKVSAAAEERLPTSAADSVDRLALAVKGRLQPQPPTDQAAIILVSTVLLAIASTIYSIWCPEEVRDFSRAQWCHELNKWLVHYWARSWTMRGLRITCGSLYVVGALLAGWLILSKVCWAAYYLATWH
jgi:uncharacterized protein YjbI with pentapeptide repeats